MALKKFVPAFPIAYVINPALYTETQRQLFNASGTEGAFGPYSTPVIFDSGQLYPVIAFYDHSALNIYINRRANLAVWLEWLVWLIRSEWEQKPTNDSTPFANYPRELFASFFDELRQTVFESRKDD